MSLLSNLKKNRQSQLEAAAKGLSEGDRGSKKESDPRFWRLGIDEQGNGGAIIRFLPAVVEGDEMPWVKLEKYTFKGPTGKWYSNNSLNTLGQKDPVREFNSVEWNKATNDAEKEPVRKRKVAYKHLFNIYVIKDLANPENEGKVFLYEAGKMIFGMIQDQAKPEPDELTGETKDPVFVWDLWEGSNFRFKAYTEAGYLKYDKSEFETPSEFLGGNEEKIEEVLKQCHSLNQFLAPEHFKSYDQLKKELDRAMGYDTAGETPEPFESPRPAPKQDKPDAAKDPAPAAKPSDAPASSDDDDLAYFKSLMGG